MNELLNINLDPDEMDVDNDLHPVRLPISNTGLSISKTSVKSLLIMLILVDTKSKIKLEPIIKEEKKPFENGIDGTKNIFEAQEKLLLFQVIIRK